MKHVSKLIFLFKKLSQDKQTTSAGRLLLLCLMGISLSVLVMLLSLSIIIGFKHNVSRVAYQQTGHISIYHTGEPWSSTNNYIHLSDDVRAFLRRQETILECAPIIQQIALIKTDNNFLSIPLYGIEDNYPLPPLSHPDTLIKNKKDHLGYPIILDRNTAKKLGLKLGDKLKLYFTHNGIKVRSFFLANTYESGSIEKMPAYCPDLPLRKLLLLPKNMYSRIILWTQSGRNNFENADNLLNEFNKQKDLNIENYTISTAEELLPDLFSWLNLLDSNVVFLIVIMIVISVFTMTTSVIILLLDKTKHIAILKSLGATNTLLHQVFALLSLKLVLYGLLIGNTIALILLWVQDHWKVLKLNPKDYFIDSVPVVFDISIFVSVNLLALLVIMLSILLPLRMIDSIKPSTLLRFE